MNRKTGVWIIGAFGSVATCVVAGVEAARAGRISRTGLVTDLADFAGLGLVGLEDLVFGGYDLRKLDYLAAAREVQDTAGILPPSLIDPLAAPLLAASARVKTGCALNCGDTIRSFRSNGSLEQRATAREIVARIQQDLREFKEANGLATVIVVNLASTEPAVEAPPQFATLEGLEGLLEANDQERLIASVLYAYAAIDAGYPFVNFTPSVGNSLPAIQELARRRRVPHCGKDGKTGETLVKTVLAPMFLARNLKLLAWEGHNLLGNRDGLVLRDPGSLRAKVQDKEDAFRKLVPDPATHSRVRIDYVPSLGDWKTAWDFIHFSGFLDVRMSLQFTWQGCDSALAAPLVIDLVRLAELAARRGESGVMRHTASFFKSPLGTDEQAFDRQFGWLRDYARTAAAGTADVAEVAEGADGADGAEGAAAPAGSVAPGAAAAPRPERVPTV
ncbi:MAG: inositol-3-phosphate synthase [Planctomycetes bacterium]|nr:inositol-3-phosphate synthase [Planctomycetota bacterium]